VYEIFLANLTVVGHKCIENLPFLTGTLAAGISNNPAKAMAIVLQGWLLVEGNIAVYIWGHMFHNCQSFIYDDTMTNITIVSF